MKSFLVAIATTLALSGAVNAATIYANGGDDSGRTGSRGAFSNAFGAPDGKFASIGLGGYIDLTFGQLFTGDAQIVEVTWGKRSGYFEQAEILVGYKNSFQSLGLIDNQSATTSVTFSGVYDTLRILDASPNGRRRDGFDVDSVAVNPIVGPAPAPGVAPVPVPAAGFVLIGALSGLGALKARKRFS